MKKIICAILLLAVLFTAGCGTSAASETAEAAETALPAAAIDGALRLTQTEAVSKEKYIGESDFEGFLSRTEKAFVIPGLNEGAIPQGMAYSEETGRIYISSYYSSKISSVITAVDAETKELCAEYYLYNPDGSAFSSHVGGLAAVGDKLYVSAALDNDGSYSIAELPLGELGESGSFSVTVDTRIAVPVSPSFLNCSNGYLWVGNFYHPLKDYNLSPEMNYETDGLGCYILGYSVGRELSSEDGDYVVPDVILAAPEKIQGMCFAGDDKVLLSQSYGRTSNSTLYAFNVSLSEAPDTELELGGQSIPAYVLNDSRLAESVTAMPMTEALCAAPGGGTLILFESGAMKYSDGTFRTDHVWLFDKA